jgi:hypothetical protein
MHSAIIRSFKGFLGLSVVLLVLGNVPAFPQIQAAERIRRELRIYWDVPTGDRETRSETELAYEPYYFSPAAKAPDIAVDTAYVASMLGGQGTCIEIMAKFGGPNEFVQVGFMPVNSTRIGQRPGLNIAEMLGAGRGDKVFMELRARRRANDEAKVSFRVGGTSGIPNRDSLRFPVTRSPDLDELTADWTTYRIDLTEHAHRLNAVLCPLNVTIEINKNPRARRERNPTTGEQDPHSSIVLYIDEVRFIVVDGN